MQANQNKELSYHFPSAGRWSAIFRKAWLHHTWQFLGKINIITPKVVSFLLPPALYVKHDVTWYRISLWPFGDSSPSCVPSQPLVHPQLTLLVVWRAKTPAYDLGFLCFAMSNKSWGEKRKERKKKKKSLWMVSALQARSLGRSDFYRAVCLFMVWSTRCVPQGWVSSFAVQVAREREWRYSSAVPLKERCACVFPQKTVGMQSP